MMYFKILLIMLSLFTGLAAAEPVSPHLDSSLEFIDHNGEHFNVADGQAADSPLLLVPAYFRCTALCGLNFESIEENVRQLKQLVAGRDFRLLVVSFDPRDTVEDAAQRLKVLQAHSQQPLPWRFAIVADAQQQRFLSSIGWKVTYEPTTGQYRHPLGAVVLAADGRIMAQLTELGSKPDDLALALRDGGRATGQPSMRCIALNDGHIYHSARLWRVLRWAGATVGLGALLLVLGLIHWRSQTQ